jgi:hypothetical protein
MDWTAPGQECPIRVPCNHMFKIYIYCDVFDWRPSLLSNRSRNSYLDTLTTPVLLRAWLPTVCIATNSGKAMLVAMVTNSIKARFSIGPSQCYIKKATKSRVSLSLRRSVFGVSLCLDSEWVSLRRLVFGVSHSLGSEWVSQSTPVREWVVVSRRSQKCSALEVRRQRSTVPSVGSKELRVLSVHGNCNHVQL